MRYKCNFKTYMEANIDFTSSNTTVVKFAGGVEVSAIPTGAIDAKIKFKFGSEKSFLVKAPIIKVSAIQNVNQVATKLRDVNNWGRKWKVVHKVYVSKHHRVLHQLLP